MDIDPQSKLEQTVASWLQALEQLHHWYGKLDTVITSLQSVEYRPVTSPLVRSTCWSLARLEHLQTDVYQLMVRLEAQPWTEQVQPIFALITLLADDTKRIAYWTAIIRQALQSNTAGSA
ncbi:hypothetical protein [Spirosoma agri]|uniref:Uncharacterized protein n=1 Tax=Spirosoma agri TaxID=1987381 RepID=A0A6M0IHC7_9BACT|nr:hypothetical protein [Spirosoma agri]NEU67680.1 hypothetical protein [Spirosoma agri]